MEKLIKLKNNTLNFIYKYRFIIAIILIIVGILFKLHGSSINLWNSIFTTGVEDKSLLFGIPRSIRSDEWAVTTPFIFSQSFNNFKYFSDILRGGTSTDAFSIYGLPVFNIAELFRPFHIGYLVLGLERGLSFFWVSRFIILFLVSFEFLMIFTNKNKRLSVIGSFLISLSPMVQWWFATNGTAEIFIFGMLALVLLYKYMNTNNFKKRILYLALAVICAGGYILVLYPASQIPMFFVFLALAIYIIVANINNCKISRKDIVSILIAILFFLLLLTYIINTSWESIQAVLNTVYPGNRIKEGGGSFRTYISYIDNIFLPYKQEGLVTHQAKEAVMFGLFPMGIILTIFSIIKNKKIDLPILFLMIPYVIITAFCMFKIPFLPQLTLLSYSSSSRAIMAVGFIDILVLLRSLSITTESMKTRFALLTSFVCSLTLVLICKTLNPNYVGKILSVFLFIMCMYLFFFVLQYHTKYGKILFVLGIIPTMLIAGFTVNPINSGIDMVFDSPILKAVQNINEEKNGVWLAESLSFPCANYLGMSGAPVINATNIYPNMELWKSLDKENKYEDIYNRYAHVYMELVENENQITDKFVLISTDIFKVYITLDELKEMNIKYIFTIRILEDYNNENQEFNLIYNENNYHIYEVIYK